MLSRRQTVNSSILAPSAPPGSRTAASGTVVGRQRLSIPHPNGRPLMPGNVYRQLIRVLKRAGLPHVHFDDLQHTAATLLLSARVNPKVVGEMLGHASTTITLDIYSHVLPD